MQGRAPVVVAQIRQRTVAEYEPHQRGSGGSTAVAGEVEGGPASRMLAEVDDRPAFHTRHASTGAHTTAEVHKWLILPQSALHTALLAMPGTSEGEKSGCSERSEQHYMT